MKKKMIFLGLFVVICMSSFAQIKNRAFTVQTDITLIPDSIVITSKTDTSYLIITHGNGFLTKNAQLYRLIMDHMKSDTSLVDGIDNIVTIEGTSMGALSKFYRKQFKGSTNKNRADELNGYLYRITGYKLDYKLSNIPSETKVITQTPAETEPKKISESVRTETSVTQEQPKIAAPPRPTLQQLKEREAYRRAHPQN